MALGKVLDSLKRIKKAEKIAERLVKFLLLKTDNEIIHERISKIEAPFQAFSNFSEAKKLNIESHLKRVIEISNYLLVIILTIFLALILVAVYFSREVGSSLADIVILYRYNNQPAEEFLISLELLGFLYFFGIFLLTVPLVMNLGRSRENTTSSNPGSIVFALFFTISIPGVLMLLIFRTNFIQIDHSSVALFFENIILINTAIFLIILSAIFSANIKHLTLSRCCPESHVIVLLCNALTDIHKVEDWYSSKHRGTVAKRIDRVANCFEHHIPEGFRCGTPYDQYILQQEFKKISNGFRMLKQWLHTPTLQTRKDLAFRIVSDIDLIMSADLDSLHKLDFSGRASISKQELLKQRATRYFSIIFRASIPFLLIFFLEKFTAFKISEEASTYLSIGAFALSSIILFLELDPNIGEKLNVLNQVKNLLSREP